MALEVLVEDYGIYVTRMKGHCNLRFWYMVKQDNKQPMVLNLKIGLMSIRIECHIGVRNSITI